MTAPRIDTYRRETDDAISLLRWLSGQIADLHDLAYIRHSRGSGEKVRGGSRDYALDTHGDPRARNLYEDAAKQVIHLVDELIEVEKDIRSYLTAEGSNSTGDPKAATTTDEVIRQIKARRRRMARGEYEPKPIAQQPVVIASVDWQTEVEALRSAVRKVTRTFAQDHQHCQPPERGAERFKQKLLRTYPTKDLSQRERQAWRAAQSVADPDAQKAS